MTSPKPSSKPEQYIKGWVEFFKLKFKVTPDVLIPRPETELLVDEVLNFVNRKSLIINRKTESIHDNRYTIIDIGTGSGCIAISIAKNIPHPKITAIDISSKALKVAKQNAKLNRVIDQIKFVKSDLLSNSELTTHNSELIIVANLPYIPTQRITILDSSVKDFEPHLALDGGKDGFDLYRQLFAQIREKKWKPTLIVGEIDHTHAKIAIKEAKKYFPGAEIEIKKDLAKKPRILKITIAL